MCENRTPFSVLRLFSRFPGTRKNLQNWTLNGPSNCKILENCAPKKTTKNLQPKSRRTSQNCAKKGLTFHAGDGPKITQILKFAKMDPMYVPGSKRQPTCTQHAPKSHSKDIHKASKRHQTNVQKTSKLVQIKSHWNQNSEIPMQRTAKNCKEPCTLTESPN